jgi:pyruvate dehydrogenase E1 component alpha subunit
MKWTPEALTGFEKRVAQLFEEGKIHAPIHLSGGNEKDLITLFSFIKPEDWIVSTHRSHYHYLLKGGDPKKLMGEIQGLESGCCGGRGRSMNPMDLSLNFVTTAIVGGGCAVACGIALALQKEGTEAGVFCFVGDGGEDTGHFMEAARFAESRKLPVTFVVEDNDLSVESTKEDRWKKFQAVAFPNVIRYTYKRTYPHVGIGRHVAM